MKSEKILALEKGNDCSILLFKEGLFWRAYNVSAYLFSKHLLSYKITKKYIKTVKAELVLLGFPSTSLEKLLALAAKDFALIQQEEKKITLKLKQRTISQEVYQEWFDNIPSSTPKKDNFCKQLIHKIRQFPILEKTPIESQLFLVTLQKEVNNGTI